MNELKGSFLIVGDQSGIGKMLADDLVTMGYDVIGRTADGEYYIHEVVEGNYAISAELGYDTSKSKFTPVCGEIITQSNPIFQEIHTVVDCGAINKQAWVGDDADGELFTEVMNNNAKKFYSIYQDTVELLREHRGIYITITSITARRAMSCTSQYCASKAAMVALSRVAAREEDRIRGSHLDNDNKYASFFTISPIWIPETGMGHYLVDQYMDKRKVSDHAQAEADFCSELYNKKPLKLKSVVKFIKHLILENRDLSRSLMGSDLQIGDQP